MLTRIHLLSQIAAPVVFSFVLAYTDFMVGLIFICALNVISFVPESLLLRCLHHSIPQLQKTLTLNKPHPSVDSTAPTSFISQLFSSWAIYVRSPIFMLSLGFTLLYLTALNPGALLNSYLLTQGIDEITIAIFQGVTAVAGLFPTFLNKFLFTLYGVARVAVASVWFQFGCLVISSFFFFYLHLFNWFEGCPSAWRSPIGWRKISTGRCGPSSRS